LTINSVKTEEIAVLGQKSYKIAMQVDCLDGQVEQMDMQRDQIAVQVDRWDRQVERMCRAKL
jgi:outer membrane murein-binding lipoprotein Lpp